jgi:hypothetical protein
MVKALPRSGTAGISGDTKQLIAGIFISLPRKHTEEHGKINSSIEIFPCASVAIIVGKECCYLFEA